MRKVYSFPWTHTADRMRKVFTPFTNYHPAGPFSNPIRSSETSNRHRQRKCLAGSEMEERF